MNEEKQGEYDWDNLLGMGVFSVISDKVLYLVKDSSFGPNPPLLLAISVEVHDNWVGFHDTGRGHQFFGKLVKETKDGFIWHRVENTLEEGIRDFGMIVFKALTLEEYNSKVRPLVEGTVPEFNSTEELYEFYYSNFAQRGYHY
ncbi:hypothetical protein Calow_2049 [Caldicellulosiruptor owensensis OL]|uniref:Uncharacterized protein n=1 Tax=Caldicellulosiruptor owensensis (strain ATCC 700167 / DSM 13100 / OL) TaxID=632518 RepID=E4Q675_CALOW|nr:hypothetical protein [Caldicellulosiruptor owensensis]ADQ05560.1 hypothetical protein Calow_2049 [Caldicellulosiruptor owensensis OL]